MEHTVPMLHKMQLHSNLMIYVVFILTFQTMWERLSPVKTENSKKQRLQAQWISARGELFCRPLSRQSIFLQHISQGKWGRHHPIFLVQQGKFESRFLDAGASFVLALCLAIGELLKKRKSKHKKTQTSCTSILVSFLIGQQIMHKTICLMTN